MTLDAADTAGHMGGVVEVRIVGRIVDTHPLHRHPRGVAVEQRLEEFAFRMNLRMAVHAGAGWRNRCGRSVLDRVVTIFAVDVQLAGVQFVTERNRLSRHVSDIRGLGTEAPGNHERDVQRRSHPDHDYRGKEEVRPFWKDVVEAAHMQPDAGKTVNFFTMFDMT